MYIFLQCSTSIAIKVHCLTGCDLTLGGIDIPVMIGGVIGGVFQSWKLSKKTWYHKFHIGLLFMGTLLSASCIVCKIIIRAVGIIIIICVIWCWQSPPLHHLHVLHLLQLDHLDLIGQYLFPFWPPTTVGKEWKPFWGFTKDFQKESQIGLSYCFARLAQLASDYSEIRWIIEFHVCSGKFSVFVAQYVAALKHTSYGTHSTFPIKTSIIVYILKMSVKILKQYIKQQKQLLNDLLLLVITS